MLLKVTVSRGVAAVGFLCGSCCWAFFLSSVNNNFFVNGCSGLFLEEGEHLLVSSSTRMVFCLFERNT